MNKLRWLSVSLVLSGLFAGCHRPPPPKQTIGPIPPNSLSVAWAAPLKLAEGDRIDDLYLEKDQLLVYTLSRNIYLMNRNFGSITEVMRPVGPDRYLLAPLVEPDKIIFASSEGLEVFTSKGKPVKQIKVPRTIRARPAGSGNFAYITYNAGNKARVAQVDLNQTYNPIRWEAISEPIESQMIFYGGLLYFAATDGRVIALSEERNLAWSLPDGAFKCEGPVSADLFVDDQGVYVASRDTKLYSLNRLTGKINWQYFAGEALHRQPAATKTAVYQYVASKGIVCIEKGSTKYNRSQKWAVRADQFLAEDDRNAFLLRTKKVKDGSVSTILAVDKATGDVKFESRRDDLKKFVTNTQDGTIYAATANGRVLAIKAVYMPGQTGELVFHEIPVETLAAAQ